MPEGLMPLKKININGYYRFWGVQRDLEKPFEVIPGNPYANAPPYVLGQVMFTATLRWFY
jgi:hypothetical protein